MSSETCYQVMQATGVLQYMKYIRIYDLMTDFGSLLTSSHGISRIIGRCALPLWRWLLGNLRSCRWHRWGCRPLRTEPWRSRWPGTSRDTHSHCRWWACTGSPWRSGWTTWTEQIQRELRHLEQAVWKPSGQELKKMKLTSNVIKM